MKRCTASLVLREMKIKPTVRHHFIATGGSVIKETDTISVGEDVDSLELPCVTGGNVKRQTHFRKCFGSFLGN